MKYYLLSGIIGIALGAYLATRFLKPDVQIQEVTKDRIVTVTKRVKAPDGTTTTDVTRTEAKESNISAKAPVQKNWLLSGSYAPSFGAQKQSYGISVQRRVLGPVFGGISVEQPGTVRALVTIEF